MSTTNLAAARKALSTVLTGKNVNQDSWMAMWPTMNWADLLLPTPLGLVILGAVAVAQNGVNDFPLSNINGVDWKVARNPNSFKQSLIQLVSDGYAVFETLQKNMDAVRQMSDQVPQTINNCVQLIVGGDPREIAMLLPKLLQSTESPVQRMMKALHDCDDQLNNMAVLSQELLVACIGQTGSDQQRSDAVQAHQSLSKLMEDQLRAAQQQIDAANAMGKEGFPAIEDAFTKSAEHLKASWTVAGMQTIDDFYAMAVSGGSFGMSNSAAKSQAILNCLAAFKTSALGGGAATSAQVPATLTTSSPNGIPTVADNQVLTDPGLFLSRRVLGLVDLLNLLAQGGPDGKPDWENIRGESSGAAYVKAVLGTMKRRLNPSKPISSKLGVLIDQASDIANSITSAGDGDSLDDQKSKLGKLTSDLQQLTTSTNLILHQTGLPAFGGPGAAPPAPASPNATSVASEHMKFQAEQVKAILNTSQQSLEKVADRINDSQRTLNGTLSDISRIQPSDGLDKLVPVLRKSVGVWTTLRAQMALMFQLYQTVDFLIRDIMVPSVESWSRSLSNNGSSLGGVSLPSFTRQMIYIELMIPLTASIIGQKVAQAYTQISQRNIMQAQRTIGVMLEYPDDDRSKAGRLQKHLSELQRMATETLQEITDMVAREQKQFASIIDQRLEIIGRTLQPVLATDVSSNVKQITDAYVADFAKVQAAKTDNNPMF